MWFFHSLGTSGEVFSMQYVRLWDDTWLLCSWGTMEDSFPIQYVRLCDNTAAVL